MYWAITAIVVAGAVFGVLLAIYANAPIAGTVAFIAGCAAAHDIHNRAS